MNHLIGLGREFAREATILASEGVSSGRRATLRFTLVFEVKKLSDDLLSRFLGGEFERFENRRVVFFEIKGPRDRSEDAEQMIPAGACLGREIPKARQGLKHPVAWERLGGFDLVQVQILQAVLHFLACLELDHDAARNDDVRLGFVGVSAHP